MTRNTIAGIMVRYAMAAAAFSDIPACAVTGIAPVAAPPGVCATAAPHLLQNLAPAGMSAPHELQNMASSPCHQSCPTSKRLNSKRKAPSIRQGQVQQLPLEHVPEELVVDIVVVLHFGRLDKGP